MAKLTKSAADAAEHQDKAIELRDTVAPGFLCKVTPAGRKVFMLQYRTNAGERRKPALGQYGELTVDQARTMAQEWLAEVRKGGDPCAAKNAARKAPTMKEFCHTFLEDYSKQRNRPSTQRGYQGVIGRCIRPYEGAGREAPRRGRVDEKAGLQAGRGQSHLRRAAQDLQPGRSVGAVPGRHDVPAWQGNPAHRR